MYELLETPLRVRYHRDHVYGEGQERFLVSVDLKKVLAYLALKALDASSHKATALGGAVQVRHMGTTSFTPVDVPEGSYGHHRVV